MASTVKMSQMRMCSQEETHENILYETLSCCSQTKLKGEKRGLLNEKESSSEDHNKRVNACRQRSGCSALTIKNHHRQLWHIVNKHTAHHKLKLGCILVSGYCIHIQLLARVPFRLAYTFLISFKIPHNKILIDTQSLLYSHCCQVFLFFPPAKAQLQLPRGLLAQRAL